MVKLKTVLTFVLVGALLGNVVATLAAPPMLGWYNSSSLATQTMCNLPEVIQKVSSQLIQAQLIGSGIGMVLFLVLGIAFVQSRAKKQQATPPPPAAPTPTAG
jgi:hypothetical protein